MALTKEAKKDVIKEVSDLLESSKMTVIAKYEGTTVKALQQLRKDAKANGTTVKVIKNRLVIQALKSSTTLKDTDTSALTGMLIYAFNPEDEVAAAKNLNDFAKQNPTIQFIGGINTSGEFVDDNQIKALAVLPSKNELIAGLINILNSPTKNVVGALGGNLSAILQGLEAKAVN